MSTATALAEPDAPDISEAGAEPCAPGRDARTAQREAMLRRLADIGMAMA
jgi:hypothetical protein